MGTKPKVQNINKAMKSSPDENVLRRPSDPHDGRDRGGRRKNKRMQMIHFWFGLCVVLVEFEVYVIVQNRITYHGQIARLADNCHYGFRKCCNLCDCRDFVCRHEMLDFKLCAEFLLRFSFSRD